MSRGARCALASVPRAPPRSGRRAPRGPARAGGDALLLGVDLVLGVGCDDEAREQETIRISCSAKAAPRQRHTPPPHGKWTVGDLGAHAGQRLGVPHAGPRADARVREGSRDAARRSSERPVQWAERRWRGARRRGGPRVAPGRALGAGPCGDVGESPRRLRAWDYMILRTCCNGIVIAAAAAARLRSTARAAV
jgi:hypothetical protein